MGLLPPALTRLHKRELNLATVPSLLPHLSVELSSTVILVHGFSYWIPQTFENTRVKIGTCLLAFLDRIILPLF